MKKVRVWFATETHSAWEMFGLLVVWFAINHIAVLATANVGFVANESYSIETVIRNQAQIFQGLETSIFRIILLVLGLTSFVVILPMGILFSIAIGTLMVSCYACAHLFFGSPARAVIEWLYFISSVAIFAKIGGMNGRRFESIVGLSGVSFLHTILISINL